MIASLVALWLLGTVEPVQENVAPVALSPVDNPLKGLVPYQGQGMSGGKPKFPHSLEFSYLPLSDLLIGPNRFDWSKLEALLVDVASRGNQTIFRVYLEYPGQPSGIPRFLREAGVKVTRWGSNDQPPVMSETPDYADPRLREALKSFIAQLGRRVDGDPRVAAVTAGLLGSWGEWHTWPRNDLAPSRTVEEEVLTAYRAAFRRVPVLLRYPAGADDPTRAPNVGRGFGYHDDSFAFATLASSQPGTEWHFTNLVNRARASETWRTRPIGGEIRPEVWGRIFDATLPPGGQDFDACVRATRVSWLMDSGLFGDPIPAERRSRAEASVRRMGYDLQLRRWSVGGGTVRVEVANQGVAPFYADWPVTLGVFGPEGLVRQVPLRGGIAGIQPGSARVLDGALSSEGLSVGSYRLAVRAANPMKGGKDLGFANPRQPTAERWASLGDWEIE